MKKEEEKKKNSPENDNDEIIIEENVSNFEKEYYKLKLIVLGDSGVGKTNIIHRYITDTFNTETKATIGVEFFIKTFRVNNDIIKLEIWDTAGQERYKSITSAYYKGSRGVLLVYDITRYTTFENLEKWMNEINEKVKGSLKMMIIGNKSDLNDERKVDIETALEKAKLLNIPFMETSALDSTNIQNAFENILREMYKDFQNEKENIKKELSNNRLEGIKLDTIDKKNENEKKGGCC